MLAIVVAAAACGGGSAKQHAVAGRQTPDAARTPFGPTHNFFSPAAEDEARALEPAAILSSHQIEGPFALERVNYEIRAYPRSQVSFRQVHTARASFEHLASRPHSKASARGVVSSWQQVGAPRYKQLRYMWTSDGGMAATTAGRVTALAIGTRCVPRNCRIWVGSAGGGIFRTDDALAAQPSWTPASDGITSATIGSLVLDPSDPTGNTLYAGTGEFGFTTDTEAGTGVFRTTDGGDTWTLLPGSTFADNRAVTGIALDPRRPTTIYVSIGRALHGVTAVAGGEETVQGDTGVYVSSDGGQTFAALFQPKATSNGASVTSSINEIALDPNDPDTLYVAGFRQGVWRRSPSLDRDGAFHRIFSANPAANATLDQFALADRGGSTRIYLGDYSADVSGDRSLLYRVDDARVAAAKLTLDGRNVGWRKLTAAQVKDASSDSADYCGKQCLYDDLVATPPGKPDEVWLAGFFQYDESQAGASNGRSVIRSSDGGVHWNDMSGDAQSPSVLLHPDQHALVFSPDDSAIAFMGSDGGLYRTSGSYASTSSRCDARGVIDQTLARCRRLLSAVPTRLISLNAGLPTLQFQSVSIGPTEGDLLGGTQDNGTWAYSPKTGWQQTLAGDGGQSVVSPFNPKIRFASYVNGDLYVNFHGTAFQNWDFISDPLDPRGNKENRSFYVPLAVDPRIPGTLFTGLEHIWRTKDNGGPRSKLDQDCQVPQPVVHGANTPFVPTCGDWIPLAATLTGATYGRDRQGYFVAAVQRASNDKQTLWAATLTGRVFVSSNASAAARAVRFRRIDKVTGGASAPQRFVSGIVVDPKDPRHAWISYSGYQTNTPRDLPGHVFEVSVAASGKATWRSVSYDLGDQPVTSLVRDRATGDLYASSDFGVMRLAAGAKSWSVAAPGLPVVSVPGLTISRSGKVLYAATHGRAVWQLQLRP